jgi:predicted amidophosphoribosyltransferase
VYDDLARAFVLRAKLGRRPELLRALAELVAADLRAARFPARGAVLAPVPSHPLADLRRGFSPGREIARRLGRVLALEVRSSLLSRRWLPLGPLKRLARGKRRRAAGQGFRVRRGAAVPERVILVDDVMTTGATLEACGRALKAAGSKDVRAVVWARALGEPRRT